MSTAEHKLAIVECLLSKQGKCLTTHLKNLIAFKFTHTDAFFRKESVLCVVLSKLEHGRILKLWFVCHDDILLFYS